MTDWGLIFGGVGTAAGLGALVYAHIAYRGGKTSGDLASEANDLAKGSNTIALDARRIAVEANEYSHRAESRETERHDVYWEGDWVRPGIYRIVKRGEAAAHRVKATVTYDGVEETGKSDLVTEDGNQIEFHFPKAYNDFQAEVAERGQPTHVDTPFGLSVPISASYQMPAFHSVTERIEWQTDHGTPKLHEEHHSLSSLHSF